MLIKHHATFLHDVTSAILVPLRRPLLSCRTCDVHSFSTQSLALSVFKKQFCPDFVTSCEKQRATQVSLLSYKMKVGDHFEKKTFPSNLYMLKRVWTLKTPPPPPPQTTGLAFTSSIIAPALHHEKNKKL